MNAQTLREFLTANAQQDLGQGTFEKETDRLLEVNLNGKVCTKMGTMVAWQGNIRFNREGILDQGVGNLLKKAFTGEGMAITYAEGTGKLYLADTGKKISILKLENDALVVNGSNVLAFETTLQHKITMMRKVSAMLAGGLFNIRISGSGMLAITSHFDPRILQVSAGRPVFTDPNATIAWSGNLTPAFHTDISLRTFLGRGSGESLQMRFDGEGYVVVQPYEEKPIAHPNRQ